MVMMKAFLFIWCGCLLATNYYIYTEIDAVKAKLELIQIEQEKNIRESQEWLDFSLEKMKQMREKADRVNDRLIKDGL